MIEAGYLYPKSKSPSESKYERLRGMCGGAGENVRYIPIGNGIQQQGRAWRNTAESGGAWRYMVGAVCISVYQYTDSMAAGHGGIPTQQGVYLCTIYKHSIQPPSLRNARMRVSRACVRVRYIIILL